MKSVNLVFEGGGVLGISYVGALRAIEEEELEIKSVAGSSAGALVAALIAAGYNSHELEEVLFNFDFSKLNSKSNYSKVPFVGKILSLVIKKGIYTTIELEKLLTRLFLKKGVKTFKDLKYNLKVVVTDVTNKEVVIFPDHFNKYKLDDNYSVAKAVAMSCSVPLYFEPYIVNSSYIVDGGMSSNYPIWIFQKEDTQTIGFLLENADNMKFNKNVISYMNSIATVIFNKDETVKLINKSNIITCKIETKSIKPLDFDISTFEKKKLVENGYKQTKNFINNNL